MNKLSEKLKTIKKINLILRTLSTEYVKELFVTLTEKSDDRFTLKGLSEKERFADGRYCPKCGGKHIVRNGHRKDGTQRYVCRCCGVSFVATSNTVIAGTHKELDTWKKYIECMLNGVSVRKAADICGIHRNTAFSWRHKILETLVDMESGVLLDGIVEADDTFFPLSFKGNHKYSKQFVMPREAYHRGRHIKKVGTSNDLVCVPCAVNRKGLSVARAGKLGMTSTLCIEVTIGGNIKDNSVLCTDKCPSYNRFAYAHNLTLIQIKGGRVKDGIYHIQHVNGYHSRMKSFMYNFGGVSTKYLNNYLAWNNFVNYSPEVFKEKKRLLLKQIVTDFVGYTCRRLSYRPAIPTLV